MSIPRSFRAGVPVVLAALVVTACETPNAPSALDAAAASRSVVSSAEPALVPYVETGLATRRIGDINDHGEIVGASQDRRTAFVWSVASGMRVLPTASATAQPWTITNDGVVGGIDGNAGVLWAATGATELSPDGSVEDITESGLMAGLDAGLPTIWRDGVAQRFPIPAEFGYGFFTGVRDVGFAAGAMQGLDGGLTGIFLSNGELQLVPGVASYTQNIAVDVNTSGQVVGWSITPGQPGGDAFMYENEVMSVLPRLPGAAGANAQRITDSGIIIGGSGSLPVVWAGGQPIALPLPAGAIRGQLYGVNRVGQAVGYVDYPAGSPLRFQVVIWNFGASGLASARQLVDAGVSNGDIAAGIAKSLQAQIESAQAAITGGNSTAAAGKLGAFIHHVEAQSGKQIPAALAAQLVASARLALAAIA